MNWMVFLNYVCTSQEQLGERAAEGWQGIYAWLCLVTIIVWVMLDYLCLSLIFFLFSVSLSLEQTSPDAIGHSIEYPWAILCQMKNKHAGCVVPLSNKFLKSVVSCFALTKTCLRLRPLENLTTPTRCSKKTIWNTFLLHEQQKPSRTFSTQSEAGICYRKERPSDQIQTILRLQIMLAACDFATRANIPSRHFLEMTTLHVSITCARVRKWNGRIKEVRDCFDVCNLAGERQWSWQGLSWCSVVRPRPESNSPGVFNTGCLVVYVRTKL